jgi:hypothetical protein
MLADMLKIEKTYKPGTDTEAARGTGSALWAGEGLEEFSRQLVNDFGISADEIETHAITQSAWLPGAFAGTLLVTTHGPNGEGTERDLVNLAVYAAGPERTVRMLTPVTL